LKDKSFFQKYNYLNGEFKGEFFLNVGMNCLVGEEREKLRLEVYDAMSDKKKDFKEGENECEKREDVDRMEIDQEKEVANGEPVTNGTVEGEETGSMENKDTEGAEKESMENKNMEGEKKGDVKIKDTEGEKKEDMKITDTEGEKKEDMEIKDTEGEKKEDMEIKDTEGEKKEDIENEDKEEKKEDMEIGNAEGEKKETMENGNSEGEKKNGKGAYWMFAVFESLFFFSFGLLIKLEVRNIFICMRDWGFVIVPI
jgi:hypothetical protein